MVIIILYSCICVVVLSMNQSTLFKTKICFKTLVADGMKNVFISFIVVYITLYYTALKLFKCILYIPPYNTYKRDAKSIYFNIANTCI